METNQRIVYKDVTSPVGLIRLIASGKGLMAVLWEGENYTRTKLPDAVPDHEDPLLVQTGQQLKEYFAKERTVFNIPWI